MMSAATLAFGFSRSFWMACAARFATGVTNGVVGTAKSCLADISDDTNQAKGLALVGTAWGVGMVVGPVVGGFFAQPARKYPAWFDADGLFGSFPYLLPSLVTTFSLVLSAVLIALFLDETSPAKRTGASSLRYTALRSNDADDDDDDDGIGEDGARENVARKLSGRSLSEVSFDDLEEDMERLTSGGGGGGSDHAVGNAGADETSARGGGKGSTLCELLKSRAVVASVMLYGLFGFVVIGFEEVYSLWSLTRVDLGGLGFESGAIGLSLAVSGVLLLFTNLLIYPIVERRLGAVNAA